MDFYWLVGIVIFCINTSSVNCNLVLTYVFNLAVAYYYLQSSYWCRKTVPKSIIILLWKKFGNLVHRIFAQIARDMKNENFQNPKSYFFCASFVEFPKPKCEYMHSRCTLSIDCLRAKKQKPNFFEKHSFFGFHDVRKFIPKLTNRSFLKKKSRRTRFK